MVNINYNNSISFSLGILFYISSVNGLANANNLNGTNNCNYIDTYSLSKYNLSYSPEIDYIFDKNKLLRLTNENDGIEFLITVDLKYNDEGNFNFKNINFREHIDKYVDNSTIGFSLKFNW